MAVFTVGSLRSKALRLADKQDTTVGSAGRPNEAEQIDVIKDYHHELYTKLTSGRIINPESTTTITANGSIAYTLPIDLFSVIGVYRVDTSENKALKFFDVEWLQHASQTGLATAYRITHPDNTSKNIRFHPIPTSGDYVVTYVPNPTNIVDDNSTIQYPLGYERYITYGAAIEFLAYDDLENPQLQRQFNRIEKLIDKHKLAAVQEQHRSSKYRHRSYNRTRRRYFRWSS